MKTAQWVAVLCVSAGIVFGLTFAVTSLGGRGSRSHGTKAAPQAELTWADNPTNYPAESAKTGPAECEIGQGQSHDFWFKNENGQPLPVGVQSKTCQCTSVLIWTASDRKEIPAEADREKAVKELEARATPTELKNREGAVEVPAGAVGVLRLAWKGDRAGPKNLAAVLWMGEDGPGPTRRFVIRTVFIGPLKVLSKEIAVDDLPLSQLPHALSFPCWSSTRERFPLKASVLQYRTAPESNPFVVGDPVPLTEAELAELRKNPANGPVLAGYAVPVKLLKESKDKKPFDVGIFRQRIELSTEGADPIQVGVHGTVLGDLAVVDPGPVNLRTFDRNRDDVKQEVVLESGADVAALEVDRKRTADFLGAEFTGPPEQVGGRKTWRLEVRWLPQSQAGGKFPRDEDDYRDSAVYVRPVYASPQGTQPSSLRIPVLGKADIPQ